MLVAALIVGLLGVWYLGMRAGIYAGAATIVLLLMGLFMPQLRLYCYGALILGIIGMGVFSKKVATKATPRSATEWAKQRAWRYLRRR